MKCNLNALAIIPARYSSTRFPGKPLADMNGKPMIQRVYEQVCKVVDKVYVATDDNRIRYAVEAFGGKALMTSSKHRSGTDRCLEAMSKIGDNVDVVVNVQGDEPFIEPSQICSIIDCFMDTQVEIATLVKPIRREDGIAVLHDATVPKVVINKQMEAIYFSRTAIPYRRNVPQDKWLDDYTYYKHIGIYGYRPRTLKEITQLPPSPLEMAESLEQLRWIENGYRIKIAFTNIDTISIDTPADMQKALDYLTLYQ